MQLLYCLLESLTLSTLHRFVENLAALDYLLKTEASTAEIAAIHAANELQSDSLRGSSPL